MFEQNAHNFKLLHKHFPGYVAGTGAINVFNALPYLENTSHKNSRLGIGDVKYAMSAVCVNHTTIANE
jgi:hypothetical protein